MEMIKTYIENIARILEATGVLTILAGGVVASARAIVALQKKRTEIYKQLRQDIGKAILLGLEILIAADIIATIVTEPTMNQVLILGVIVLIRIVLSLSLQVELEGRFPWQEKDKR